MKIKELEKCMLCPRNCGINRYKDLGYCRISSDLMISYYSLHMWEEPIISGSSGSGTIFFTNCNLKCIFCQNEKISHNNYGKVISLDRLKEIMIELQDKGANNINLVTPTPYVPIIAELLHNIKDKKLKIPVIYNTSSYENRSTIKMMDGLVDVYLADFKYFDNKLGEKYSKCFNYRETAIDSIDEMYKQVGSPIIENGLIRRGLIVRILVLPGEIEDAKKIINYLYDTYKDNIIISIMNQYTPIKKLKYDNLNRKLSEDEYNSVVNYAYDIGVRNAFIQEDDTQKDSFIPNFDINII